jgi:pimeloyl-ACP methyl ester carboxylesterase
MRHWLLALLAFAAVTTRADDTRECVVLLHGVGMGRWTMAPLARALETAGYRTVNLTYPSRTLELERIAGEWLPERLREADVARAPRVHFVAHSMGSLVTRLFLRDHRPAHLGRVVLLGPPNHGSVAADHAERNGLYRWLLGVNLARLGTGAAGVAPRLPPADFEVGVIAGTERVNPLFADVLTGAHDGVVTVDSARLEGMRDFLVVPHSHTGMLWREAVQAQVVAFLRDGRFTRPAAGP